MTTKGYILILITVVIIILSLPLRAQQNNDELYKNSFRPDIPRSMQEIPFEDEEYLGKNYSPYVLVKIIRSCRYENNILTPGYYLVKPFTENNADYLIFKKSNLAVAVVPVLEKAELPKKLKKMEAVLMEDAHGKYFIITIKYQLNSYTTKLKVVN